MSTPAMQRTAQSTNRPGRHRRSAGADTWTPAIDPMGGSGRHRARHAAAAEPDATEPGASISGELPVPAAAPVAASAGREAGVLPAPAAAAVTTEAAVETAVAAMSTVAAEQTDELPVSEAAPQAHPPESETADVLPPVQRTKVTLAAPVKRECDDDVRVYLAPPDGLSGFDLGTVPASVTPPRSWRKAAWFATVSSGGVAVALLLAGSYLVGQPMEQNQAIDGWTGFQGEPPAPHDQGIAGTGPNRNSSSASPTSSAAHRIRDLAGDRGSRSSTGDHGASTPTRGPSVSVTGTPSGTPSPSGEPSKPPTRPADRETRSDAVYRFPPDAQTMGDRSEIFLNEITENPGRAHEQTGGELYAEGAESIASRYAHIAYFEVQHIYIDQRNRVTVNDVVAVFTDGTSERQQRTLRFEDGDRITQD